MIGGFFILGIYGLIVMPKNLFPDSDRPTVIVISQIPGATPDVVTATVSKPIEQELSTLSLIRQVSSTNIAGMSIVTAEFEYKKGLDAAAVDVNNAINKVRLPVIQAIVLVFIRYLHIGIRITTYYSKKYM